MICDVAEHFVTARSQGKTHQTGAINAQVCAMNSRRIFSQ
jgi:hypothetical protein